MAESIFNGEVSRGLQGVENRYVVCRGLFGRARELNRAPVAEGESAPNPSATAVREFSFGHLLVEAPEAGITEQADARQKSAVPPVAEDT